ncbi:pyridoxal kinase [Myroides odoratus]|uniref:pyridoxal kinase n=1 Tax=Myroides odoratus TaxID=256 RepID=A0A378RKI0_MYROD|nr:pyridoxal kinase [Myroides odoratus]QQU02299.1 pyridoxal kinase [Myroides odoratus]STZ26771.1 Pyridoxine kinase [Myroides odoratus]
MKSKKTIIIHSKVAYGYVGSNTTSLVLQVAGQDAIAVPTVILSNRYGLPTVGGGLMPSALFQEVLDGILKLNILDEVSSIVTGYIGSAELVEQTAAFIRTIKKSHPDILYLCDPVMGDQPQGLYVNQEVPKAIIEHLLPLADVLTPNQFEIETILNQPVTSYEALVRAVEKHPILQSKDILITGCRFKDTTDQLLHIVVKQKEAYKVVKIDYVPIDPPGTGELFAALVLLLKLKEYEAYADCAKEASILIKRALRRIVKEGRSEFDLNDILTVHAEM